MGRLLTAIQDSPEGACRVGRSLEGKGLGRNGSRVRRKLDLLSTRTSSDTRIQGDLEIGARAAIGLILRRRRVPVPRSHGGTVVAATGARRNLDLHMPARRDAYDDPPPEPQHEKLGQQCQEEGKAAEVGEPGHPWRRLRGLGRGVNYAAQATRVGTEDGNRRIDRMGNRLEVARRSWARTQDEGRSLVEAHCRDRVAPKRDARW